MATPHSSCFISHLINTSLKKVIVIPILFIVVKYSNLFIYLIFKIYKKNHKRMQKNKYVWKIIE